MRFYVQSRLDPQQKLYIRFAVEPQKKENIPYELLNVNDINGILQIYNRREVWAEPGDTPAGVALVVGALLFIADPLLGILGGLGSGLLASEDERKRVKIFNSS